MYKKITNGISNLFEQKIKITNNEKRKIRYNTLIFAWTSFEKYPILKEWFFFKIYIRWT